MGVSFRHSAGFGKRMEYNLVGQMLMEGLDVYLPLVDDHGVDCVIKKEDGTFIEIQIKARSNEVAFGDAALFAAITHELTPSFFLYSIQSVYSDRRQQVRSAHVSAVASATPEPALGYCSSGSDNASSAPSSHHTNRTSGSCRDVPDRSCGCVPPYRYAMVSAAW